MGSCPTNEAMSDHLEQSFVKQLKENQNIIHKICRLYTNGEDAQLPFSFGKPFRSLEGSPNFLLGRTVWH